MHLKTFRLCFESFRRLRSFLTWACYAIDGDMPVSVSAGWAYMAACSSIIAIKCFLIELLKFTLLSSCMSLQRRTSPEIFGNITTGQTHGFRPSTFSMVSNSSHHWSTPGSMWCFMVLPVSLPIPVNDSNFGGAWGWSWCVVLKETLASRVSMWCCCLANFQSCVRVSTVWKCAGSKWVTRNVSCNSFLSELILTSKLCGFFHLFVWTCTGIRCFCLFGC